MTATKYTERLEAAAKLVNALSEFRNEPRSEDERRARAILVDYAEARVLLTPSIR